MTFALLDADPDFMKAGNKDLIKINGVDLTNQQWIDLQKDPAKKQMKLDMQVGLYLPEDSDTRLDEIVDLFPDRLSLALSYLQLSLEYTFTNDVSGSEREARAVSNMFEYDLIKSAFSSLVYTRSSTNNRRSIG